MLTRMLFSKTQFLNPEANLFIGNRLLKILLKELLNCLRADSYFHFFETDFFNENDQLWLFLIIQKKTF